MFLSLKTLYRKRTVIWPFYFYTIIRTLSQSLNLNSQNILSNTKKIETDNIDSKEDIITPKASKKNEQKQSIFSKLFKKKLSLVNYNIVNI